MITNNIDDNHIYSLQDEILIINNEINHKYSSADEIYPYCITTYECVHWTGHKWIKKGNKNGYEQL